MKMKMMSASMVLVLAAMPLIQGCAAYPTTASPSTHYIASNDKVTRIGPASGSAFVVCPLGICGGEMKMSGGAVDRALKSSGADALIDVRMDMRIYNLMFLVVIQTNVYGTGVKLQKGG